MRSRSAALLAGVLLLSLQLAGGASASWSVGGTGTSVARADVLAPPTSLTAAQSCTPTQSPGTVTSVIAHRASSAATGAGTVTASRPEGTQPGDVLVASYVAQSGTTASAPDATWTSVGSVTHSTAGSLVVTAYTRTATADDPAQWTWGSTVTASAAVSITAYSGVDAASPVNAGTGASGTGSTVTAPSITPTVAGTLLHGVFSIRSEGVLTAPASMTARSSVTSTAGGTGTAAAGILTADEQWPTATATGTRSATATLGGDNIGALLALRPASSTVTGTITFQGALTAQGNASLSFTSPSYVAAGDVLVVGYGKRAASGTTFSVPTGWTQLRPPDGITADYLQTVFWRLATSSDAGSTYTFTSSDSLASAAVLAVYRGVDQTLPVLAHSGQAVAATSSITAPSITPGRTDSRLVGVFGITANARITGAPAGMTLQGNIRTTTGAKGPDQFSVALGDEPWPPSTATGSRTATASAAATTVGQLVALKPASYPTLQLSWTATTSSYADGYALELYRDGSLAGSAAPSPAATTTHTTGTLVNNATYRIELRTRAAGWRSLDRAETTVTTNC